MCRRWGWEDVYGRGSILCWLRNYPALVRSSAVGAVFEFLEVLSAQLFVLVYSYFYDGVRM